jgi:hypothetical protein
MVVVLVLLVICFFATSNLLGYLCLQAQSQRDLYYNRWLEANKLLEGADLDAVADGKPLLPRGRAKEQKTTPWGALEKRTHTQLTQERLNKMTDYHRYETEKARLKEGLEPVDSLEGMGDYYTTMMIKLRAKEGWD